MRHSSTPTYTLDDVRDLVLAALTAGPEGSLSRRATIEDLVCQMHLPLDVATATLDDVVAALSS